MRETGIVRKSPIVIVRDLLALQFAASALYFLAASLAYFAQVWRSLALDDLVSFQVAQWIFVFLAETLIVFGDRDPFYPVSLAFELRAAIPGSYLWVVPNAGHGPVFGDNAPRFAETATAFLRGGWKRAS